MKACKQVPIWIFLTFIQLFPLQSYAQTDVKINPESFDQDKLTGLIFKKINEIRDSLGVPKLGPQKELKNAAELQAEYIKSTGELTHRQKKRKFSTPAKRVKHFGGKFMAVAENVAYASAGPTVITQDTSKFTFNTYEKVAQDIVQNWLNSPGHFENIADPSMDKTAVAVAYDSGKNLVYAVQVFTDSTEKPMVKVLWFRF